MSLAEIPGVQVNKRPSSLSKALRLLRRVSSAGEGGATLSWLARKEGLAPTTTHRLLRDLVAASFLSLDPYAKVYRVGPAVSDMAAVASPLARYQGLREELSPSLEQLAMTLGDSTYLSVRYGDEALCIDRCEGSYPLTVNTLDVGAHRPLGVGAGSLALLAALPLDERERIVEKNAEVYARYGKLSKAKVRNAIKGLKNDGYTFNRALVIPEVGAIGVPFLDPRGDVAGALSLGTVLSRLRPKRRREIAIALQQAVVAAGYTLIIPLES